MRRSFWLIVACVVLLGGAAATHSALQKPTYESQARVIVSAAQEEITQAYAGGLLSAQRAATYADVVGSGLMAENVKRRSGTTLDVDTLIDNITATAVDKSSVLKLRFTSDDPHLAQQITQAYAEELVDVAGEIEKPDNGGELPTKITVIDAASLNEDPISPKPVRDLILALVFGLILGVGLALLREMLNTRIVSNEDLRDVTEAPVLVSIAHTGTTAKRLVTDLGHHDPRVEAFRVLRTNVQFVDVDASHKTLVVTSSLPEEGKTSTAVNLALTLARAGVKTLLLDGDLRRPRIASTLEIDNAAGVTMVLLGHVDLESAIWTHPGTGLDVLTSGSVPPNASELLQTQAMANLLKTLRSSYEIVIIDTPPLLPVTDASILAAKADATVVVVRHGRTRREQLEGALERLHQVDISPAGIVLNHVPAGNRAFSHYGGYGVYGGYGAYGSYGTADTPPVRKRKARRADREPETGEESS